MSVNPLESLAESRIQEAIDAGEFDNLAGAGKPLDLDGYFAAPSSLRAGFGMLKSAGIVPPEVEAMRQVTWLRDRLEKATKPEEIHALREELRTREVEVSMALERMKRSLKADAADG